MSILDIKKLATNKGSLQEKVATDVTSQYGSQGVSDTLNYINSARQAISSNTTGAQKYEPSQGLQSSLDYVDSARQTLSQYTYTPPPSPSDYDTEDSYDTSQSITIPKPEKKSTTAVGAIARTFAAGFLNLYRMSLTFSGVPKKTDAKINPTVEKFLKATPMAKKVGKEKTGLDRIVLATSSLMNQTTDSAIDWYDNTLTPNIELAEAKLTEQADLENKGWVTQIFANAAGSLPSSLATRIPGIGFVLMFNQVQRNQAIELLARRANGEDISDTAFLASALGSGAIEIGSEMMFPMFGRLGSSAVGKSVLSGTSGWVTKILGKTAKETAEKVIKSGSKTWFKELSKAMAMGFLEEGAEEVVGELASAYLAKLTTDKDVKVWSVGNLFNTGLGDDIDSLVSVASIINAFATGGVAGAGATAFTAPSYIRNVSKASTVLEKPMSQITRADLDTYFNSLSEIVSDPEVQKDLSESILKSVAQTADPAQLEAKIKEIATVEESPIDRQYNEQINLQIEKYTGVKDTALLVQTTEATFKEAPPSGLTATDFDGKQFTPEVLQPSVIPFVEYMHKNFNVKIQFGSFNNSSIDSKWNGMYDAKTNLITINTKSNRAIESVVWHEVTHFIQETNPQAYKTLVETIKKNTKRVNETTPATKGKGKETTDYYYPKVMEAVSTEVSSAEIMNEYVADVVMELADNMGSEFWDTSTTQSRNVLKTISTQLKKIYSAWGVTKTSPVLKGMSRIDQVIKAIDTALETAIKKPSTREVSLPKPKAKVEVTTDTTRRETITKPKKKKPPTKKVEPVKAKPTTKVETKDSPTTSKKVATKSSDTKVDKVPAKPKKVIKKAVPIKAETIVPKKLAKDTVTVKSTKDIKAGSNIEAKSKGKVETKTDKKPQYSQSIEEKKKIDNVYSEFNKNLNEKIKAEDPRLDRHSPADFSRYAQTVESIYYANINQISNEVNNSIMGHVDDFIRENISSKALGEKYRQTIKSGANVEAQNRIAENLLSEWEQLLRKNGKVTSNDIAKAVEVARHFSEQKQIARTDTILSSLVEVATETARATEAMKLIAKATPMGTWKTVKKSIDRLNIEGKKKYKNKWVDFVLTPTEMQEMLNTKFDDVAARDDVILKIGTRIANDMPRSFWDFSNSWRKLAMLCGVTTHEVNFLSNVVYAPLIKLDSAATYMLESVAFKNRPELKRVAPVRKKVDVTSKGDLYLDLAQADYKNNVLPTLGQINDMKASTRSVLGVEVSPFGNKNVTTRTLNKISDFIGWALNDLEDMPFFKIAYERSLMNYMKAQSLTEVTPEARVYATEFALEATYKNGGVVIELIEGAKKTKSTGVNVFVDTIAPFTRTPINLVKVAMNHSPIGLGNTVFNTIQYLQSGTDASTRAPVHLQKAVSHLAMSLTGSAISLLGMAAFWLGYVTPPPEDDFKLAQYRRDVGESPYAIKYKDKYYPISFVMPAIAPMIAGISFANAINKSAEKDASLDLWGSLWQGTTAGLDVIIDLPLLQSTQEIFKPKKDAHGNDMSLATRAFNVFIGNWLNQHIPNLTAKFMTTLTPNVKTSFTPKDSSLEYGVMQKLPYAVRKWLRETFNKTLPMLNLDKVNVWGQPIPRADTVAGRIYQQMFAPAKVTKDKKTAVDNELIRLAKVFPENKTIYPALAQLYIKHKNENINLTIDEYNEWQKICGQTSLGILENIVKTKAYNLADDETKANVFEMSHAYSKTKAGLLIKQSKGLSGLTFSPTYDKIAENLITLQILNKDEGVSKITFPREAPDTIKLTGGRTFTLTQDQQNNLEKKLNDEIVKKLNTYMSSPVYISYNSKLKYDNVRRMIDSTRKTTVNAYIRENYDKLK